MLRPRRSRCKRGPRVHNPPVGDIDDLRKALVLVARALPQAEARLVEATALWRPENAQAYRHLHVQVKSLRSELERIAAELERLQDGSG